MWEFVEYLGFHVQWISTKFCLEGHFSSCQHGSTYFSHATQHTTPHTEAGRREGTLCRFRQCSLRSPLPAIVLANVRSLRNKTDELFHLLTFKGELRDSSILCFTETSLDSMTPDAAVPTPRHALFRADRSSELTDKERCVFWWISDGVITPSLSLLRVLVNWKLSLSIASRSNPRENYLRSRCWVFTPPPPPPPPPRCQCYQGSQPVGCTSGGSRIGSPWQRRHHSVWLYTNLVLPRYKQHVDCATSNSKILDHCYTIFKDAYRATARAPLGESDQRNGRPHPHVPCHHQGCPRRVWSSNGRPHPHVPCHHQGCPRRVWSRNGRPHPHVPCHHQGCHRRVWQRNCRPHPHVPTETVNSEANKEDCQEADGQVDWNSSGMPGVHRLGHV